MASKVLRLAQCSVLVVPARCAITRLPEVKQQIRTADAIPHR
jgi:hypothetical protein